MTEAENRILDPLAESLNEACDRWFATPEMAALAQALRQAAASLPPSFTVSMDVELRVFDSERERSLTLLTTGIVVQADGEPYRASGDSTVHRYIVDGTLSELPHDRCPPLLGRVGLENAAADVSDMSRRDGERCAITLGQRCLSELRTRPHQQQRHPLQRLRLHHRPAIRQLGITRVQPETASQSPTPPQPCRAAA